VTFYLILINTLAFVVTVATGGFDVQNLVRLGALAPALVFQDGEFWRILTSMFLHGSVMHFLMNMVALYYLGTPSERGMGSFRYVLLYLLSGFGSGAAVILLGDPYTATVGASGALYGLMGALLLTTFKKWKWFTPASARSIRSMIVLNFVITFLFPAISIPGHLGGFLVGVVSAFFLLPKVPRFFRAPDRVPNNPPTDPDDSQDPPDPFV
jgi:rhomboid protease GluP